MIHPGLALALLALGLAVAGVLLWPVHGLLWRALGAFRATERVRIEDALKHLYDCEYRETLGTLHSLAGALGLSSRRTVDLIARLEAMELVAGAGGGFRLTSEGRRYALRVIRVHRLWERYLAEETGVRPAEWHARADVREHTLSAEEADALAARMGYPRVDPHGDPIPTAEGHIPPPKGQPLTQLAVGERAEIVHLEDEPAEVYAQLVAAGLHPGQRVRITEVSTQRLCFEADAEEHVLAPVVAAHLTVVPLAEAAPEEEGPGERLSRLEPGDSAVVTGISALCRGQERRRLLDLGLVRGTRVAAELRGPGRGPTGYRIRGALIALRREQADLIFVEPAKARREAA